MEHGLGWILRATRGSYQDSQAAPDIAPGLYSSKRNHLGSRTGRFAACLQGTVLVVDLCFHHVHAFADRRQVRPDVISADFTESCPMIRGSGIEKGPIFL
jgi:hypothetical protein